MGTTIRSAITLGTVSVPVKNTNTRIKDATGAALTATINCDIPTCNQGASCDSKNSDIPNKTPSRKPIKILPVEKMMAVQKVCVMDGSRMGRSISKRYLNVGIGCGMAILRSIRVLASSHRTIQRARNPRLIQSFLLFIIEVGIGHLAAD